MHRAAGLLICAIAASLHSGCASTYQKFDREALKFGLAKSAVRGSGFVHAIYRNAVGRDRTDPIKVYLTGDGSPYIRPGLAAADPTPRHPVVPKLLAMDTGPGLILGRPCYHGYADSGPCTNRLWTQARFSETVVASMTAALARTVPPGRSIVFIGFSGGGTLALLIARRVPRVVAVITLAGNLDTDGWTSARDYEPLRSSLNPAKESPLPRGIVQLHYVAARDAQVPRTLSAKAVKYSGGELIVLPGTTHNRGWDAHWPQILRQLEQRLNRLPADLRGFRAGP